MGLFKKRRDGAPSSEADAAFRKIYELMTDEAVQNRTLPREWQELIAAGGALDELPGAVGDFGRDARNPIPVNGPLGELVYISNLRVPSGANVMAHRLGSGQRPGSTAYIDFYELVALDGSRWDILFFDPYHTRKSRLVPDGYVAGQSPERFLLATNQTATSFPVGFADDVRDCTMRLIGVPLVAPQLRDDALFRTYSRPESHKSAVAAFIRDE